MCLFCSSGTPPSNDKPLGNYPMLVARKSNPSKKVLVVQDFTFGKYLGVLKLTFDSNGEVTSYGGNPILLNGSYAQDPVLLRTVESMAGQVKNFSEV